MKNADEIPLAPHVPRNDVQRFNKNEADNHVYDHQCTRGCGPVQSCMIVEQYRDGYCKVITGPGINGRPATAMAWSGCLTKKREMDKIDRGVIADYLKAQ